MSDGTAPCPKLRDDLVVSPLDSPQEAGYVIKDPTTGRFFRFGEPEIFLARQLDGTTPLETIRRGTEARFAATLSPTTLEHYVGRLVCCGERRVFDIMTRRLARYIRVEFWSWW